MIQGLERARAVLLLLGAALLGLCAASAQVIGLQPTPIGLYEWNPNTAQWQANTSSSTSEPLATTPQAYAFYSFNATLGQWVPCTTTAACLNTGVTQLLAGTGISLSPSGGTGAVTITNTGVTQLLAGTNVTLSPSGGTGIVTVNAGLTPGNGALTPFYTAPAGGQYVVLYPTSAPTLTNSGTGNATAAADVNAPYSGQMTRTASCSVCAPPNYAQIVWTGTTLPAYINPANVTAIYGGYIASGQGGTPWYNSGTKYAYANSNQVVAISPSQRWPQGTYTTEIASGSGAQTFDYATMNWTVNDQSSNNWSGSTSESTWTPVLFVYYTGTAPPSPSALFVLPPLSVNDGTLSLMSPIDVGFDTGSANSYAVSIPGYTSTADGLSACFLPGHSSTSGTPTLNVNGWGAWTIVKQGGAALASGDLLNSAIACVRLDNGAWELQDPQTTPWLPLAGGTITGSLTAPAYKTSSVCASSASPAACGSAAAGYVAVAAGTNPTLVVDTTAVTASSQITLTEDETLGAALSVTCQTAALPSSTVVTARSAGTSFTIQANGTFATNPVCYSYTIVN